MDYEKNNSIRRASRTKSLLSDDEIERLHLMGYRIELSMKKLGIKNFKELSQKIYEERGESLATNLLYKIKYPPVASMSYYNLSLAYLLVLADALEVSTDYLLGKDDKKNEEN